MLVFYFYGSSTLVRERASELRLGFISTEEGGRPAGREYFQQLKHFRHNLKTIAHLRRGFTPI